MPRKREAPGAKVRIRKSETIEDALRRAIRKNLGQAVYVEGDPTTHVDGARLHRLAVSIPEAIRDAADESTTITFLTFDGLSHARVVDSDGETIIELPSRSDVQTSVARQRQALAERLDKAVLKSAGTRLLRASTIENTLNPLEELLVLLYDEHRINLPLKEKHDRYIPLLRDLEYVRVVEDHLEPGAAFVTMRRAHGEDPILTMLSDIVSEGYTTLVDHLNLVVLTAVTRTAGSVFWPSRQVGRRVWLRAQDVEAYQRRIYGKRARSVKTHTYLYKLAREGVLERTNGKYEPAEEVWNRFAQMPLVPA